MKDSALKALITENPELKTSGFSIGYGLHCHHPRECEK